MNLKKLNKSWRDSCPEESDGLVSTRKKGNRWERIKQSSKAKLRLNKDKK